MKFSEKVNVRYIVCGMGWFTLFTCYTFRSNMSTAILVMASQTSSRSSKTYSSCNAGISNISQEFDIYPFDWNQKEQGYVLSSFFVGYISSHFIGSVLSAKYGLRNVMGICLVGATIFTFLMVPFAKLGLWPFVFARIMVGFFSGPLYPIIHELISNYATPDERTILTSFTHTGNVIGLDFTFGVGGFIVEKYLNGWIYLFYMNGFIGIINIILWFTLVYSNSMEHPLMSKQEKMLLNPNYIQLSEKKKIKDKIPFKQILTNKHVHIISIANFGNNIVLYALLTGTPKYINGVYGVGQAMSSFLSIIPFSLNTLAVLLYPLIFKYQRHSQRITKTTYRKINSAIAFLFANVFLAIIGFLRCSLWNAIALLSASMIFLAPNQSGFFTAMIDISPKNSGIIMGIASMHGSFGGIIQPQIASFFLNSGDKKQAYKIAYLITTILSFVTGYIFVLFGSSEDQNFESPEESEMEKINILSSD